MRIGELARLTGTSAETIRYYEKEGLLPPPARTGANYRSYGLEHRQRLTFIRRARDLGFRLGAVRELLALADDRSQPCAAVDAIAGVHLREINSKIADLQKMQGELQRLVGSCDHGTVGHCRIIETLDPTAGG